VSTSSPNRGGANDAEADADAEYDDETDYEHDVDYDPCPPISQF